MNDIAFFIVGLLLGALVVYAISRSRIAAITALWQAEKDAHNTTRQSRQTELDTLKTTFNTQLEGFRSQITLLAEQTLKARSEDLQKQNAIHMDTLLRPLQTNINKMEQSINENRLAGARNQASLEKTIQQMMDRTEAIGQKADRLSNALQRENKTQGNWGELVLTELLEAQGLREGENFFIQTTLTHADGTTIANEESGSSMIPDVILKLNEHPNEIRKLVVDSKVSLLAYVDYCNATNDVERQAALRRHIDSMRTHVKELSKKDYSAYIESKERCNYVLMFVPHEGALQLAFATDESLWRDAFNKHNVLIVGAQTLLAALRIIELTWVNIRQERNVELIMKEAGLLLDRTRQFYQHFQGLSPAIANLQEVYKKLDEKAITGQQSILKSGLRLEELGAKGRKPLPRPEA